MKQVVITRKQYEKLKEVFEMYDDLDRVIWKENNSNGIGPVVSIEFNPTQSITVDITDLTSW